MSNRKLSAFELELLSITVDTILTGTEMPPAAIPFVTKIQDCLSALKKNFNPAINGELWAAAHNPVFLLDKDMGGKNAIDFLLDTILAQVSKDMKAKTPQVSVTVASEKVTTTVVTETSTPVTDVVLARPMVGRTDY